MQNLHYSAQTKCLLIKVLNAQAPERPGLELWLKEKDVQIIENG